MDSASADGASAVPDDAAPPPETTEPSQIPQPAQAAQPRRLARAGAGVGALGGVGAIVGFFMPWFIFVAAIQLGCHRQLQVELYDLSGAALALTSGGREATPLALLALLCALALVIVGLLALRRPTPRRARLLLIFAIIGVGALGVIGAMAGRSQIIPQSASYSAYLGFADGFWITVGALLLSWLGGAILHAATRPHPRTAPIAEGVLATLAIVGLLASGVAAIAERPAPYPTMTCAREGGASAPAVRLAYVTSADGVYALDAASGRVVWRCRNPLGGVVTAGAPPLADGALIVASRDGYVYAVRVSDATILWRADVGGHAPSVGQQPHAAPIVQDGVIYGVNAAAQVYALRASDGARLWMQAGEQSPVWNGSPVSLAGDALTYLTNENGGPRLTALDSQSGRQMWLSPDKSAIAWYPVSSTLQSWQARTVGDVIYSDEIDSASGAMGLTARSITDGALRWRVALSPPGVVAPPDAFTVAHGVVYVEALGGSSALLTPGESFPILVALRAADGVRLWSAPESAISGASGPDAPYLSVFAAVASDDTGLYLVVSWGHDHAGSTVYAFDADTGAIRWSYGLTQPAAAITYRFPDLTPMNGVLYLLDSYNTAFALDARSGALRWRRDLYSPLVGPTYGLAALTAPSTADNTLYLETTRFAALDAVTGASRWQFTPDAPITPYSQAYGFPLPVISPATLAP